MQTVKRQWDRASSTASDTFGVRPGRPSDGKTRCDERDVNEHHMHFGQMILHVMLSFHLKTSLQMSAWTLAIIDDHRINDAQATLCILSVCRARGMLVLFMTSIAANAANAGLLCKA